MDETRLAEFVTFARGLKGEGKSEVLTFLTRLFQAFGHAGSGSGACPRMPAVHSGRARAAPERGTRLTSLR